MFNRMTLNEYVARTKREVFDDIVEGRQPSTGLCDLALLDGLRAKAAPQMGTTVFAPDSLTFEFIFSLSDGQTEVFQVKVSAPERIVYLPVPEWVVESVWQGEVAGSFHFESDARVLVDKFQGETTPDGNTKWFQKQLPKRRE
jgi:hypothetical protein